MPDHRCRPGTAAAVLALPLAVSTFVAPLAAQDPARRMAVTLDDLPVALGRQHTAAQRVEITERLIAALGAQGVPAIGFVNESQLEVDGTVDPGGVALLERWLDAGHELGNHGYAHLDLHAVGPERWLADAARGERVLRPLVESRGGRLQWFRHPYLRTGRSRDVQERTTDGLARLGYRVAPVTIDNDEWIYARAYAAAWNRRDDANMDRLGRDYIRYMLEVTEYYERESLDLTGRFVPQVLLIHAYALNADWLGTLLDVLTARGYVWVTLEEAVADPAYARPTHGYTGRAGISWLHRWAITEGHDPAIAEGQPEAPAWVRMLSDEALARQE